MSPVNPTQEEDVIDANAALKRAWAFSTSIIDRTPIGIFLLDAGLKLRHVNPVARPIFFDTPDLIGSDWVKIMHLLWPEKVAVDCVSRVRHTLHSGESYLAHAYTIQPEDGSEKIFFDWEAHRIAFPDGQFGIAIYFTNISQYVRAEEALRVSERKLRAIFDQVAVGIATTDLQGRFVEVNQRFSEMLGYSREEFLGHPFPAMTHSEDLGATLENVRRLLTGEINDYVLEKRYICKDGSFVWALVSVTLVRDAEGKPSQLLGVIEDISQRRLVEEEFLRLGAVVESSDDAIISKTFGGIITSWNRGAQRIFGYAAHEVVGKSIAILFPPERLPEEQEIIGRLHRGERIDHYETVRVRKNGTPIDISLTVSAIRDGNGRPIGISKIARDITERKRAEKALMEAQMKLSFHAEELERQVAQRTTHLNESIQSLESVCYTIAHDLRAPLRAIQGFTQIIVEDYSPAFDEDGKGLASRIMIAATRMDALIRDLLEYARLSHVDLPIQDIDLDSLVQRVIDSLQGEITAKSAQIRCKPLPTIRGNVTIVDQVFSNLLSNALKFVTTNVTPVIDIWAETTANVVRVFVHDNGIGIPIEHHERIFGMFQRLHDDEKQFPGTGVGLAIVKKGMERMDGHVGLDSRRTPGSCFYLNFQPVRQL